MYFDYNYYNYMYQKSLYDNMYNNNLYNGYMGYNNYYMLDSGSSILFNNGNKLEKFSHQYYTPGYGYGSASSGGGSPVPVIFPDPDPSWYTNGYPGQVNAGSADGNLVEYIPVSFYARNTGKIYFGLGEIDIYAGYLNSNGQFVKTIGFNGTHFNKGDFCFAILMKKYAGAAKYSKVHNDSYWNLLSDISNIQPGQTVTKSVTITSGVTTEESKTFSTTVGSTVGFKAGIEGSEVSASLSVSLTSSFSTSVSVTTQMSVTDTVNFPAQQKQQRVALYQFVEKYGIVPGGPIQGWRDYLNGTSTDEAKVFSSRFVCSVNPPPVFNYPSRYFATSYVLKPD